MEAIVAATRTNSRVLGIEAQVGTIEPGKQADIIIVDGDPLQQIEILQDSRRIKLVMKGGEILKSSLE
jgi:imidazolonepropionase-like amidohydrolase